MGGDETQIYVRAANVLLFAEIEDEDAARFLISSVRLTTPCCEIAFEASLAAMSTSNLSRQIFRNLNVPRRIFLPVSVRRIKALQALGCGAK